MVSLTVGTLRTPCAPLGPVNPLPLLTESAETHTGAVAPDVPPEVVARMRYGHLRSAYPYLARDGYPREWRDADLRVAVLDNGRLRATFLLDLGGRLWSLLDLETGRELLHQGDVLRFANLGLCNAWFAGGVEWNIGTTGHAPGTTEPVHAARLVTDSGDPVLRMYEWDRLRDTIYQVDAWLPDGADRLHVYVRITNPNGHAVPMYWWSNTAVPQSPGTRVLAPARSAYQFGYGKSLDVVPVPEIGGVDHSYPMTHEYATDYFYRLDDGSHGTDDRSHTIDDGSHRIDDGQRPWIAAVDETGTGLVQTSTARLHGRKLFVWGTGTGGRHWQEWLGADRGHGYLEIQAGLVSTQMEHIEMPAGATWSWVESYGPVTLDPALAHHAEWPVAVRAVRDYLDRNAPAAALAEEHRLAEARADQAPAEVLHVGSGWGALELRRRQALGLPASFTGTPFPAETLTREQERWVALLETGALPAAPVDRAPSGYVKGEPWRRLLSAAPPTWETELHLGHIAHALGDLPVAEAHYERSLALGRSAWALRGLGLARLVGGDADNAVKLLAEAHELALDVLPLSLEFGSALLSAGRPADALALADRLGDQSGDHRAGHPQPGGNPAGDNGRVALLAATAALRCGRIDRASALLEAPIEVADVREGEVALDQLWVALRTSLGDDEAEANRSIPFHYDFRMKPAGAAADRD